VRNDSIARPSLTPALFLCYRALKATTLIKLRFASEADEVNGFYVLATLARVRGLPDGTYEISRPGLALLDDHSIRYSLISTSDVVDDSEAPRNPLAVEL
jgi:hypothetical protein